MSKEALELMKKLVNNPITKFVTGTVIIIFVAVFSSFVTGKNMQGSISSFTKFQFKTAVTEVIKEEVTPQLEEIKTIAISARDGVVELQKNKYETWAKDITKYYEKFKKGDIEDFTETNYNAMTDWWKTLPDSYKNDSLKMKYAALIDYYSKVY